MPPQSLSLGPSLAGTELLRTLSPGCLSPGDTVGGVQMPSHLVAAEAPSSVRCVLAFGHVVDIAVASLDDPSIVFALPPNHSASRTQVCLACVLFFHAYRRREALRCKAHSSEHGLDLSLWAHFENYCHNHYRTFCNATLSLVSGSQREASHFHRQPLQLHLYTNHGKRASETNTVHKAHLLRHRRTLTIQW